MTQSILDRDRAASAARTAPYLAMERGKGTPHPASQSLMRRPRAEPTRLDVYSALDSARAREAQRP
ncbi:MAG: hypothetical protein JJU42_05730 [Rhodobacteraceae bacterium]|nr:hypothetical protein [Paracoccaceae bacterium]